MWTIHAIVQNQIFFFLTYSTHLQRVGYDEQIYLVSMLKLKSLSPSNYDIIEGMYL